MKIKTPKTIREKKEEKVRILFSKYREDNPEVSDRQIIEKIAKMLVMGHSTVYRMVVKMKSEQQ